MLLSLLSPPTEGNCSDDEDSTAMSGLHEPLVWTRGNSWLDHAPNCFSSCTLLIPLPVFTVMAIFLHSPMHFLNYVAYLGNTKWKLETAIFISLQSFFAHLTIYFSILCVLYICKNQLPFVVFATTDNIYQIIYESVFPFGFPSLLLCCLWSFWLFWLWFTLTCFRSTLSRRCRIFIGERLGNFLIIDFFDFIFVNSILGEGFEITAYTYAERVQN